MRLFTGNGHYVTGQHRWFSDGEQKILVSYGFYLHNYQEWPATELINEFEEVIVELDKLAENYGVRDPWHCLSHTLKCFQWECRMHPNMHFYIAKDFTDQPIRCPILMPRSKIQRGGPCD